jgi:cell surface protein
MLALALVLPSTGLNQVFASDNEAEVTTSREAVSESPASKKLAKFAEKQYSVEGTVGEQKELVLRGLAEDGSEVNLDLEVEVPEGWKPYVDVTAKGNKLIIRDKGKAWSSQCIVNDKSNKDVTVRVYIEFKEPVSEDPFVGTLAQWNFDKTTNTLKGFKDKNNPTEVVIPKTIDGIPVKHIDKDAFKYSSFGGKVNNRITKLTIPEGIESTGYMSFQGNDLTEVKLPKSLTSLGGRSFYGNTNLKKVEFSEGINLELIQSDTFQNTGLESIVLPDSVKKIESGAFNGSHLKSIKMSDGVSEIGDQAFSFTLLEEFTMPTGLQTLGKASRNSGVFFRTFSEKTEYAKGTERFAKVYDSTGKANVLNTRAVVNPQAVTIKFQDENGKTISEDKTYVGAEKNKLVVEKIPGKYFTREVYSTGAGDGHYYTDYLNPFVTNGAKVYSDDAISKAIIGDNYYTVGNSYEFTPEYIKGYISPEKLTKTISKDDHEVIFTYKEAEKVEVKTEGEGVKLDVEGEKESLGKTVNFTVYEPSGKVLDKLLLNDEDIKDKASFDGLKYSGSFEIKGKTLLKAVYKDAEVENKLEFDVEKTELKLGETSRFTVKYRGKAISLPNADIEISTDSEKLLKINEAEGSFKAITAKNGKLKLSVKSNPALNAEKDIQVEAIDVDIRMEDLHNTVISKTPVKIDKLYFTAGVDYYTDVEFDAPVPALAIEKALKAKGVNTASKEEFDCGDNCSWMKVLGKGLWTGINPNGSCMYSVDNKMADKVISEFELKGGENICVFYDDNWMVRTDLTFFDKEEYVVEEGEEVEFTLMGSDITYGADSTPKPVSDAVLEFVEGPNAPAVSEVKTDAQGKIKYKFDKPGEYKISAVVEGKSIARPYAKVVVKKPASETELNFEDTSLENKDQNVNFGFDKKNVSFVIGEAKSLVLKLNVDISNMYKNKIISEENKVGSLILEEDGKAPKELEYGKDYTVREGSIILNINGSYLNSLSAGSYRLMLKTKAGFASIGLTAVNPAPNTGNQPQVQPGSAGNPSVGPGNAAANKPAKGVLTGDFAGITNYVMIGGFALAIIIMGLVARRKVTNNK